MKKIPVPEKNQYSAEISTYYILEDHFHVLKQYLRK